MTQTARIKLRRLAAWSGLCAALGLVAVAAAVLWPIDRDLDLRPAYSREVVDADGLLLRAFQTDGGHWRLPLRATDVDPTYLAMLLAYEDRRFFRHSGVDALAMARAVRQMATNGRVVSGASTLTMQVGRIVAVEREERGLARKWRDMRVAWWLERHFSKADVLDLYLSRAPYGGNLEGLRAASLAYFGREPRRLTPGQAALLVALPQAPEARRPDRHPGAARQARDRVLERMQRAGILSDEQANAGRAEAIPQIRHAVPAHAFHEAEALVRRDRRDGAAQRLATSLRRPVQAALETLVRERVAAYGPKLSAAMLVVEHETGKVIARIGAADPSDADRRGWIDMTRAIRSPGSSLKPFIYALAFENGLLHPESLIDDRPSRFGSYAPSNFDLGYQGTVSVREALQKSLNIPAVAVLDAVGPARLVGRLRQTGAPTALPRGEEPGLAIGLGGIGITLEDLVTAYTALARGGEGIALRIRDDGRAAPTGWLTDPVSAWYAADILAAAPPPEAMLSGRFAFKTGTSYGYRDAFAVGFDGKHVVGVWVGRPDGSSVPGLSGRSHAAPLLFEAFQRVGGIIALKPPPAGAVIANNARLPPPLRHFGAPLAAFDSSEADALRIVSPPDGVHVALGFRDGAPQGLFVKTAGGQAPLTVLIDGAPVATLGARRDIEVQPSGPGFMNLSVIDRDGRAARVRLWVE